MAKIYSHKDLEVYKLAYKLAMEIFEFSKSFPKEEKYSLTDQIRRSSRSAAVNLPEAWRKRKYPKHFVSKITDSEGEASETQSWLEFSKDCGYISEEISQRLDKEYDKLLGMLVNMRNNPGKWTL
ncbi:MAG: four helix bundle protein [Clostridia bacterium]|nr:four helix bundle protein [Clostridia bacterium]